MSLKLKVKITPFSPKLFGQYGSLKDQNQIFSHHQLVELFEKNGRCGLVGQGVTLGVGFNISKAHASLSLPTDHHEGHGLTHKNC